MGQAIGQIELRRVAAPLPEAREGFDGDAADPVADGDDADLGLRLLAEDRNEGGRVVEPSAGPHGVAIRLGEGLGIWASLGHAAFRDGGEALGEGNCRPLAFEFMFQSLDHDFGDACGFRRKPATHSDAKPASVPI